MDLQLARFHQYGFIEAYHSSVKCKHWWIQGGAAGARPPPGPNSFIFAYVFAKKCPHRRLAPPMAWRPPQREILDPLLVKVGLLEFVQVIL